VVDDISTETERVKFLQATAQIMLTKARIKLNIKRLYSADGLAVKELLKVASLLHKATQKAAVEDEVGRHVMYILATIALTRGCCESGAA
jgi:clusterin-associated protein 1